MQYQVQVFGVQFDVFCQLYSQTQPPFKTRYRIFPSPPKRSFVTLSSQLPPVSGNLLLTSDFCHCRLVLPFRGLHKNESYSIYSFIISFF